MALPDCRCHEFDYPAGCMTVAFVQVHQKALPDPPVKQAGYDIDLSIWCNLKFDKRGFYYIAKVCLCSADTAKVRFSQESFFF